jgi:alpha-L-fucosidase 2
MAEFMPDKIHFTKRLFGPGKRLPLLDTIFALLFGLLVFTGHDCYAGTLPTDVLAELNGYNVVWTSPSTNGSPGSMPLGNGDITANVWVENNGGDLMLYLGKSDSWSEGTRLLKVGRVRTHFSPNPFASGLPFTQTLDFYHGEIDITAGPSGSQVYLRIYIDANQPVIRIEASGQQNFTMSCSNEIWRSSAQAMNSGNQDSFRGVAGASPAPSESADVAPVLSDRLEWYHQNASSYFNEIFNAENLSGYSGSYTDPWATRIFGATILADNFSVVNSQQLQSGSGTNFLVSIYPCTMPTGSESIFQILMNNQIERVETTSEAAARTNHYDWWDAFWNRSWIFVSGDTNAITVTRGYLEQRFMEACQGRGQYPIKFNGGAFTFDHNGQNGDYRAWGPGYWNQNTRLLYWPLLASGDFDMMLPFFNLYTNMLPVQTAATLHYYGHGGAFFPETFNIFGLYYGDDWGWNNTGGTTCGDTYIKYHYQGGLETLAMMLAYYNYTQDSSFATNYVVPMGTQVIRFFNEHWSKVNGKLFFYPANACEMYWSCTNSTDYISGLMSDISQLMALPGNFTTPALVTEWSNCLAVLPPLPMDSTGAYVKPAQTYGVGMNTENPECYCIFPYRLYGLGLTNFNVGLATFNNRTVRNYKSDWSQDVIEEPLVGLTSAAQSDVINNFNDTDPTARFQAYWTTRNDYLPTEDTGGAAMSGLQFMLMQCVGNQIQLLPSWPSGWNVDFKLNAPGNTTVRLILTNGTVTALTASPATRTNDFVESPPAVPSALTANGGNTEAMLGWNAATGATGYNLKRANANGGPYTTIATGVTALHYFDTGLLNGTNYYYVVSASGIWGESSNSAQVAITPGSNFAVRFNGDLIANLQSADLSSSTRVWTNRTSNAQSVGNFNTLGGNNLDVVSLPWNGVPVKSLFVNAAGNNSVQSALVAPSEIVSNNPVSVEAWIYPVDVNATSCYLNYGYQGGSGSPMNEREFDYDTSGHGVISGNFGSLDTAWTTTPTAATWHYVAVTYDGTSLSAYVDGKLDVSRVIGVPISTVKTLMQAGSAISGTGISGGNDPFHGYIACARAESGVLSAGDVAANYALGPLGTPIAGTPTGLAATAGDGQVALTWNPSVNATNYNVKRSTNFGGPYTVIATNLIMLNYSNTGLTNGTTYYFVVTAVNPAGESANSAPIGAQPMSTTPPQLSFEVSGSQLQLAWPPDHLGWALQTQTNPPGAGLGTNWVSLPGSEATNQMTLLISPAEGSAFFRLIYP